MLRKHFNLPNPFFYGISLQLCLLYFKIDDFNKYLDFKKLLNNKYVKFYQLLGLSYHLPCLKFLTKNISYKMSEALFNLPTRLAFIEKNTLHQNPIWSFLVYGCVF